MPDGSGVVARFGPSAPADQRDDTVDAELALTERLHVLGRARKVAQPLLRADMEVADALEGERLRLHEKSRVIGKQVSWTQ